MMHLPLLYAASLLLHVACTPSKGEDTAQPDTGHDDTGHTDTGHDDTGHTDDTGPDDTGPDDTAPDCVDYSDIVAQCDKLVVLVDGGGSYYAGIDGSSSNLVNDLHNLIDNHSPQSYDNLWEAFKYTDARPDGTVWDMYSDPGNGDDPAYTYEFEVDQCGTYDDEGVCYNREHLWPRDWFDGLSPMKTDLHHVVPVDGYVNSMRSSYPFGPVGSHVWRSENGSMRGDSSLCDYSDKVFEPIDAYKGDIARAMLYMAVRYRGEDSSFTDTDATTGAHLDPWFEQVMIAWHLLDPVSDKERDRNDAVQAAQLNRNPFIDHPEYVCAIADF